MSQCVRSKPDHGYPVRLIIPGSIGGPVGLFSKALRDVGKRIKVPTLRGMGLREDSIWNEVGGACVDLASYNARDIRRQLEYTGVSVVDGYARFDDESGGSHHLVVSRGSGGGDWEDVDVISTDKVLLAKLLSMPPLHHPSSTPK